MQPPLIRSRTSASPGWSKTSSITTRLERAARSSSIAPERCTCARGLSHDEYGRLAAITAGESVDRDELTNQLLYQRRALEYYDDGHEVWLGVHPVIVEIDEFQEAYGRHRQIG